MRKVFADTFYWVALINLKDQWRERAVKDVQAILLNQNVEIIFCQHERVLEAIEFYGKRLDKGYSLTDCISMLTMKSLDLQEILAHDNHFEQEGFTILL